MDAPARYLIGVDLGTTNTAVAYIDMQEMKAKVGPPPIHLFEVPQLIAEGELRSLPTLPSFLYFPREQELAGEGLRLPWEQHPNPIVGLWAREQGALVPGQQVASAKSWLCLSSVDRTARILPWGAERPEQSCSPVEASTRFLSYLRDAWNHTFAASESANTELLFERQEITLTVPASFDEEARELTVQAARAAGFERLTLLEEPLAAFYAWIASHMASLKRRLKDNDLVLICDVGGGTTDFSLIRVRIINKVVQFERIAIGEHLLLGGDNVDLALAHRIQDKLKDTPLTLRQQNALRRQCCAAKEKLLSDPTLESVLLTLLGSGRSVIGSSISTELTRAEVLETLIEGFLPLTQPGDLPAHDKRVGLRELGLPYASEPAITKHLAAFLHRSYQSALESSESEEDAPAPQSDNQISKLEPGSSNLSIVRPDAILFNGGFFASPVTRERIVQAIAGWFQTKGRRWRPKVLENEGPESAVAVGAAYYGLVRHGAGLRISGGSARAYYIGVQSDAAHASQSAVQAVCVMPRGTEEGTRLELTNREFTVLTNRPVSFTLYSTTMRHDAQGDVVMLNEHESHRHAPLITVLRYGKRSREIELAVQLAAHSTEVGTLELWCESPRTGHRWRLQFQLRGAESQADAEEGNEPATAEETQNLISEDSLQTAMRQIRAVFGGPKDALAGETLAPESLTGKLESTLGYRKDSWPMDAIRKLCDVLAEVAAGRKKGRQFEARWLNLFGFCLRPGFGSTLDSWRISQARKIYHEGLVFGRDLQCQVEWLILWRRIAGGLNAGQQQELYQTQRSVLGLGGKKGAGRINRQMDQEGWLLLASLEHLPASVRLALGQELITKIEDEPTNKSYLWSLGRLGARTPFYGPLNAVVPAQQAASWIEFLLELPELSAHVASAVVQLGARTGDPLRDINEDLRERAIARLSEAGTAPELIESLRAYVPPTRMDAARIFGESLPEGLRLVH